MQFTPEQYTVLLSSIDMLKRNAHTEPRSLASGHNADWSALLVEGGIRPFVTSVITALYHEGNTTSIDRLMQCMCGTYYSGDINTLASIAGAKVVYFGAFVHFQVRGHSEFRVQSFTVGCSGDARLDYICVEGPGWQRDVTSPGAPHGLQAGD